MPGYRERHHVVTGTITCEVWSADKLQCIDIRLRITPNEKKSYISNDLLESGSWSANNKQLILNLHGRRKLPWSHIFKDEGHNVAFEAQEASNFSYVSKRELPKALRVQLAAQTYISDPEVLWPYDSSLGIHGTLGSEALKELKDQMKMKLAPGLRIRSTVLGDYVFGPSHTCSLPPSEVSLRLGEFYANQKYIELSQMVCQRGAEQNVPKKGEIFFPDWVTSDGPETVLQTSIQSNIIPEAIVVVPEQELAMDCGEEPNSETPKESSEEEETRKIMNKETISFEEELATPGKLTNEELNKLLRQLLDQQMTEFKEWDLTPDEHNQKILEEFKANRKRLPDGRYQVCLPWNEKTEEVSTNKTLAKDRLQYLVRSRFKNDEPYYERYKEAIQELKELKVIQKVDQAFIDKAKKAVYFPHHCVSKLDRISTKDRVVWDGSAHEPGKLPINTALEEGPNLLPPLQCMLMLCRQGKYLVTGDLKKAFFQVALDPEDKILLFMYWWEKNEETGEWETNTYWFIRLPWGLNCSPFILQAAIKFHGEDHLDRIGKDHPDYKSLKEILRSMYIDDIIKTYNLLEQVKQMIEVAGKYLKDGGWDLVKLRSNSKEVNDWLEIDETTIEGIKLLCQKVLGIIYDIHTDTFKPNVENVKNMDLTKPLTKRRALSAFSQMYDPLRFLAPWLFTGQLLFQKTQRKYMHWDTVLEEELQDEWRDYLESHDILANITVPREVIPYEEDFEVHIFADACNDGYAAVAYAVWPERNSSSILMAMTRIVPDKLKDKTTINRLELNGAVLATLIAKKIRQTFSRVNVKFTYWLDSMVSLWWIHGNKPNYQIYITNRVQTILECSNPSEWRHVPGVLNPADYASRGIKAEKMKDLKVWLEGPEFLLDKTKWPAEFNANVKPPVEVAMAMTQEEIPYVELLACNQLTEQMIQLVINDGEEPVRKQAATFIIQMGNSPIEREIPRTPHKSKLYDSIVRSLVYVTRWPGHRLKGAMKEVVDRYNLTSPFAGNPYQKEWDIWKRSLLDYTINYWATIDSMDNRRWTNRGDTNHPLTCLVRTDFTKRVSPPHRRSNIDPSELEAAELLLIRDVQKHYFNGIYEALKEVRRGGSAIEAYKRLTPKDKELVDKHQIIMDQREILLATGRFIKPDQENEKEQEIPDSHISLVSVMKEYFDVYLGEPENQQFEHSVATQDGEEPKAKRVKIDWQEDRVNKWLKEHSSVIRSLILIPNRGLIAESIMRAAHNRSGHAGISYTMKEVNMKFWIIKPTKLYNHVKTTCFMCRFFANKLWQVQEGLLPSNKIYPTYPFQFVGIDIAGPLFRLTVNTVKLIRQRSKKKKPAEGDEELEEIDEPEEEIDETPEKERKTGKKYYALIIVCATTRAVDYQLMTTMSTQSVVEAFESFVHSRGRPTYVLSDNASCFEEYNNIIQKAIRVTLNSRYVQITWVFIPTYSPWWGGQYEIFVRLMKTFLQKFMPTMRIMNLLQAVHALKAAEGCINNRPLYAVPRGINEVMVGTPMRYLRVGFNLDEKYIQTNVELPLNVLKQLALDQSAQIQEMWQQIHQEYLTQLRKYHQKRGCFSKRPIKVGDIVLIKNDNFSRNFWPIAIVERVFYGRDKVIRCVRVKKYMPHVLNTALRKSKYNQTNNKNLTDDQIRSLMGYFVGQKRPMEVRNLVPLELWKGDQAEPEDMDDGQVASISVGIQDTRIKGSVHAFWDTSKVPKSSSPSSVSFQGSHLSGSDKAFLAMGYKEKPRSTIHKFDKQPREDMAVREPEVWTGAENSIEGIQEEINAFWECYPEPEE